MKKTLAVLLSVVCCFIANAISWKDKGAEPTPAKYESFEDGVPKTWTLKGKGKLSINPWHYKLGKKSLQWDFKSGDIVKVNNTIGDPRRRGLKNNICFACFGVWVYMKEPMKGKSLRFEFREGEKSTAYFDFPLNFKGWQCGYVWYNNRYLKGKVSTKTDNIRIIAPKAEEGRILIDLLVYNGPRYAMFANILPNTEPWRAPEPDMKKYPVPRKVSKADKQALTRIQKELLTPVNITGNGKGSANYQAALNSMKILDIVEDEHGIRGKPINVPRDHGNGEIEFYTYNGIALNDLEWYNDTIVRGDQRNKWSRPILVKTVGALKAGVSKTQYKDLCRVNVKLWKFLLDQGFNTSYGYGNYYSGTCQHTAAAIYAVRNALFKSGIMDQVFQYAQYKNYPLFADGAQIVSMDNFGCSASLFYLVFLYSQDERRQIQALRALRDRLSHDIIGDFGACGFKPDGCGYHCTGHGGGYTRNGIRGIAEVAAALRGSSFALTDEAFQVLKKVAWRFYFYSNHCEVPIFMQGTSPLVEKHPRKYKLAYLHQTLKNLALAGKDGCDNELAQAYVNLKDVMKDPVLAYYGKYDPIFEQKYGIRPSAPPQGNISMPYMPIVAQRRDGWLAVAYGGGLDMRGRGNHYMYHGGNGPLSILGKDGFFASGNQEDGWDWNRTNGTTCLYMPDLTSIKYIHSGRKVPKGKEYLVKLRRRQKRGTKAEPIIKRGNGGISWRNVNGCFRCIFHGDRLYNDFSGIKSYFFIDDRIYALGSNLKSDNKKYHVQTNLYQKLLRKKDAPTYVDGKEIKTFPVENEALDTGKPHFLIDPEGNGYFVPGGQKVFVARKTQHSKDHKGRKKTTGDFATAWLEHGVACQDGKYCYVVMPYCDKTKLAKFSDKDFEVLRQDGFAHILHDKIDNFYAGIFFKGGDVGKLPYVKNVERDCQIMYKENNGNLEIAVGDPDVHRNWTNKLPFGAYGGKSTLTPLKITFAGSWKLESPVDGVKIISSDKEKTVIEFACIHGKTFNFTLIKYRVTFRIKIINGEKNYDFFQ